MNRIKKTLLVLSLTFSLIGCANTTKENEEFATFIKELPQQLVSNNGFDLNFYFYDANAYGFNKQADGLLIQNKTEVEKEMENYQVILKQLKQYPYKSLSTKQQMDYVALEDFLNRQLGLRAYLDNHIGYLGSFVSYQAQLPLLLMEYEIRDAKDVEIYLETLKSAPKAFEKMIEIEKERQVQGTGLSKVLLDGVKNQAINFSNGDISFLIDSFNTKIDNSDLSSNQKKQAKKNNEKYTKENLVSAYRILGEQIATMTPQVLDGGIANQANGKEYFMALFESETGLHFDIEELKQYVKIKEEEYQAKIQQLLLANSDIEFDTTDSSNHGGFNSVQDNMDYLIATYSSKFPKITESEYVAKAVPKSMQDNFSPAAYLTSRIDRTTEPLMLIVNGSYGSSLFNTIAHEGYPGHMYQDSYFQQKKASLFRYFINCSGYSEGWATYIEWKTPTFTKADNETELEVASYSDRLLGLQYVKWDIAINYDGMTREEFKAEVEEKYDSMDAERIDEMYTVFMETPTNYLQYYISGYFIDDLYNQAKEELGHSFDDVDFHKVVLDSGSVGLQVVAKNVAQYIKENK